MENSNTCLPCKKPAKHAKLNKRAMGNIFKLQQQTRRSINTKKSAQSIADDKILMKSLIDLANCCVAGKEDGCLINCCTSESNASDKHVLDKALELLRDCRETVRFKSKKERSTFLYNCFQESRITRQDNTQKIFHQWKLNNHQVNIDHQHSFLSLIYLYINLDGTIFFRSVQKHSALRMIILHMK